MRQSMKIRDGIVLDVHSESVYGFEFFIHRSPPMQVELDCFIQYASGKKCLFDIGSFHGLFSLVFAKINPQGTAYAFEPAPEQFKILVENGEGMNNIYNNLTALSDHKGTIKMKKEWEHFAESTGENEEIFDVECCDGDSYCHGREVYPDILKIDVEGGELKVLKGFKKTLREQRPTIFLELHMGKVADELPEIISLIEELNYNVINTATGFTADINELDKSNDQRLILLPI
jgi:FkbM family methyltransferase